MERRDFLKFAFGAIAGAAALAASAQAAPLLPQPLDENDKLPENPAQPAVTSKEESDQLTPEEVRWGRGRGRGWGRGRHRGWYRRRRWGWRRRRYWGYRRRWRRRYWRRRRYW